MTCRCASRMPTVCLTLLLTMGCQRGPQSPIPGPVGSQPDTLLGDVQDQAGRPVSEARVRFKGHAEFVLSDSAGKFQLNWPQGLQDAILTAAHKDYIISGQNIRRGGESLTLRLTELPARDDSQYSWVDPVPDAHDSDRCGNCHREIYDEWSSGGHAHSADNRRLQNLYDGSDWQGRPGHGWNLLADHPHGGTICLSCHIPTHEARGLETPEAFAAQGVAARGIHCDFCHKVRGPEDGQIGLQHGTFALRLLRPSLGQLFFGPLDDVDRGEDVHAPFLSSSRFCAACHEGTVFGIVVYKTYSEWLHSPARQRGLECQDCHMRPTGRLSNIAPGAGGIRRDPHTLASHQLLPGGQAEMLRRCLDLKTQLRPSGGLLRLDVTLRTKGIGHHLPTGYIDRHLILRVQATDQQHARCAPVRGDRLGALVGPEWQGDAGYLFARVLSDGEGNRPIPFWQPTAAETDTRLAPERPWTGSFYFPSVAKRMRVTVSYRRFWYSVSRAKQWPDETVLIHQTVLSLPESFVGIHRPHAADRTVEPLRSKLMRDETPVRSCPAVLPDA